MMISTVSLLLCCVQNCRQLCKYRSCFCWQNR